MKRVLTILTVGATALSVAATAGWAQNPQATLSWGSCPPQVANADFAPAAFNLVASAKNLTAADANVGVVLNLLIGPNCPDAWRFDDSGCQTGAGVTTNTNAFNKTTCPALKGLSPLGSTNYFYDSVSKRLLVNLSNTYDTFTPAPATNYTMYQVSFDHAASVAGAGNPPSTCGGADLGVCIAFDPASSVLLETVGGGTAVPFTFSPATDGFVTWNSGNGCPGSVPTEPATWGKVKGLYR
jgi:hypothetical protein